MARYRKLTEAQALRYSRQIFLPGFDVTGQKRLLCANALVVGIGGLGCAAAQYLVAAGVGRVTLVDADCVEASNLQRQILFSEDDVGKPKVRVAKKRLTALNPDVSIQAIETRLGRDQADGMIAGVDVVLDCTDNLATRGMLNRISFQHKKPLVSGAAIRTEGQLMVFTYGRGEPCYACVSHLFGEQELACMEAGVLSPVVGVIGALQDVEALKILTAFETPMTSAMLHYDALTGVFQRFVINAVKDCPVCAESRGPS